LFTIDLADELAGSGVVVNALHPATYMNTTMVRQSGVTPISSVEQGAEAILRLAVSPEMEDRTGLFFNGQREARADAQAYDAEARQRLKAISTELGGLSAKEFVH
jgi:NAD(P)-dependent dehydrogenase (short-subunit alcohol dehydrogenase family)